MNNSASVRLDKFLANLGVSSRRSIKKILKENDVLVNGKKAKASGIRIDPKKDVITINGQKLFRKENFYFLLNKPAGIVSTSSDEYGRQNVVDLIDTSIRIYPVGRLDKETRGLILLTNDGELTHKLTHPKFHVPKTYLLKVNGKVPIEKISQFRNGVILKDGITSPAKLKIIKENINSTILEAQLFEGRYRQIRRMCEVLRIELIDLQRIKFGPIELADLKEGDYRELSEKEIKSLKAAVVPHGSVAL